MIFNYLGGFPFNQARPGREEEKNLAQKKGGQPNL